MIGGYREHDKPLMENVSIQNTNRHYRFYKRERVWNDIPENDSDDWESIINKFIENKGGMLIGRAGTGKSYVSIKGMEHLKTLGKKSQALAFTNKATIQLKGKTIHKFFTIDKDGKVNKKWALNVMSSVDAIFVDEMSMISAHLWKILTEFKIITGIPFILIGDYRQLPPVENSASEIDWFNHSAIFNLCKGMRCELTTMKRYDILLWDYLERVCSGDYGDFLTNYIPYTIQDLINGTNITYTNKTRQAINKRVQDHIRPADAVFMKYKYTDILLNELYDDEGNIDNNKLKLYLNDTATKEERDEAEEEINKKLLLRNDAIKYHQDAYIFNGAKLIMWITPKKKKDAESDAEDKQSGLEHSSSEEERTLKKNECVEVIDYDDTNIIVGNAECEMTFLISDFHKTFILGYATTIHKSQGDTCEGMINIFDSEFMTGYLSELDCKRALYTAISRGKSLADIHIRG